MQTPVPPPASPAEAPPEIWDMLAAIAGAGGALVAIVAAGVAIWQARIARSARDATAEQARVAREALELQRAEQHRAQRPQFHMTMGPPGLTLPYLRIVMLSGPAEIEATIRWTRTVTWVDPPEIPSLDDVGTMHRRMIKNSEVVLPWTSVPTEAVWIDAEVTIESAQVGGDGRTWLDVEQLAWEQESL